MRSTGLLGRLTGTLRGMDGLSSPEPIEMQPMRVRITHDPPAVLLVDPNGTELDLRPAVELVQLEIHPVGCFVTLTMRADVDLVDFPARTVFVTRDTDLPDPAEIDSWISAMSMGQTLGEVVREHLESRLRGGA